MTSVSTKDPHVYILCGLLTLSDVPLTSIAESRGDKNGADVCIRLSSGRSPIPKEAGNYVFQHSTERSLIRIEGVGDFEVCNGRDIRIWPYPGVHGTQKNIEIFVFGPVWATLCHQRGMLPLHASAIATPRGVIAFAGHSGAGKSTTSALLSSMKYELVTDDILPISFNADSVPGAWPYLRRLKLKSDAISHLALVPTERVSETIDNEKSFVRPRLGAGDRWNRLDRVYILDFDPSVSSASIDPISGAEAVRALVDQTYHFHFISSSGQFGGHLATCAKLASKVPVYRLRRPRSISIEKELKSILCAHLERDPP
jgi:hypothetical protein